MLTAYNKLKQNKGINNNKKEIFTFYLSLFLVSLLSHCHHFIWM